MLPRVLALALIAPAVQSLSPPRSHTRRAHLARLIGGAALFGVGWGIAGLCPGPGIAALVIEPMSAAVFVAAMLVGMAAVRLIEGTSA